MITGRVDPGRQMLPDFNGDKFPEAKQSGKVEVGE